MHELSLAGEVIKLAEYEAGKNNAVSVSEITIEVGNMSGIGAEAFESALGILAEGSVIGMATINIVRTKGTGICHACSREFEMNSRIDTCPECDALPAEIRGGNEFRVVSLVIET